MLDLVLVQSGTTAHQAFSLMSAYARRAEELGLRRFWVAEHHGSPGVASMAPAVLAARLTAQTARIRVGSGGVMLPNHSPLVVAEQFASLAAMEPDRVDLGIGRGPGTADLAIAALLRQGRPAVTGEEYEKDINAALDYLAGNSTSLASLAGFAPAPWLLASSEDGAGMAARFGLPLSFAHHIRPDNTGPALARYRAEFRPSRWLERPYVMVSVTAVCADTDRRAQELARPFDVLLAQFARGRPAALLPVGEAAGYRFTGEEEARLGSRRHLRAVGSPETVRLPLAELVASATPDELMLVTPVYGISDRFRSLELITSYVLSPAADPAATGISASSSFRFQLGRSSISLRGRRSRTLR